MRARIVATVRRRSLPAPVFDLRCQGQPLTQASPYDAALPGFRKFERRSGGRAAGHFAGEHAWRGYAAWNPQRDLLGSAPDATEFVVEIENDGVASLRFGDDEYGQLPEPETAFEATYRVGNGALAMSARKRSPTL